MLIVTKMRWKSNCADGKMEPFTKWKTNLYCNKN